VEVAMSSKERLLARAKERITQKDNSELQKESALSGTALLILEKAKSKTATTRKSSTQVNPPSLETKDEPIGPVISKIYVESVHTTPLNDLPPQLPPHSDTPPSTSQGTIPPRETARVSAQRLLEMARKKTAIRMGAIQDGLPASKDFQPDPTVHAPFSIDLQPNFKVPLTVHLENHDLLQQCLPPSHSPPLPESSYNPISSEILPRCSGIGLLSTFDQYHLIPLLCPKPSFLSDPWESIFSYYEIEESISFLKSSDFEESELSSLVANIKNWGDRTLKQMSEAYLRIEKCYSKNQAVLLSFLNAEVLGALAEHLHQLSQLGRSLPSADNTPIFLSTLESGLNVAARLLFVGIRNDSCHLIKTSTRGHLYEVIQYIFQTEKKPVLIDHCLGLVSLFAMFDEYCHEMCDHGICTAILDSVQLSTPEKLSFAIARLVSNPRCCTILVDSQVLPQVSSLLPQGDEIITALCCYIIGVIARCSDFDIVFETTAIHVTIFSVLKRFSRSEVVVETSLFALMNLCRMRDLPHREEILSNIQLQNQLSFTLKSSSSLTNICLAFCSVLASKSLPKTLTTRIFCEIFRNNKDSRLRALSYLVMSNLVQTNDKVFHKLSTELDLCQSLSNDCKIVLALPDLHSNYNSALVSAVALGVSAVCQIEHAYRKKFHQLNVTQEIIDVVKQCNGSETSLPPLLNCLMNLCGQHPPILIDPLNVAALSTAQIPTLLLRYISKEKLLDLVESDQEQLVSSVCSTLAICSFEPLCLGDFDNSSWRTIVELYTLCPQNRVVMSSVSNLLSHLTKNLSSTIPHLQELGTENFVIDSLTKTYTNPNCCECSLNLLLNLSKESVCSSRLLESNFCPLLFKAMSFHERHPSIILAGFLVLRSILVWSPSSKSILIDEVLVNELCLKSLSHFSSDHEIVLIVCDLLSQFSPWKHFYSEFSSLLPQILQTWITDVKISHTLLSLFQLFLSSKHGSEIASKFGKHGICPLLLRLLREVGQTIQPKVIVCEILSTLCDGNQDNAMKCGDFDGCTITLDILFSAYQSRDSSLMKSSSKLLSNLICFHSHNQITCGPLASESLILYLFSSWEADEEVAIKENLLCGLSGLCHCVNQKELEINQRNLCILRDSNVVKGIANCLRKFQTHEKIVQYGSQIYSHLSSDEIGRNKILDEGVFHLIPSLVDIHHSNFTVLLPLSRVIASLSENHRCATHFENEKIGNKIFDLVFLTQDSELLLSSSCKILSNLLRSHIQSDFKEVITEKQEYYFSRGIFSIVTRILQQFPQSSAIFVSVLELLYFTVHSNPFYAASVTNSDLLELVIRGIDCHFGDVIIIQTGCLLLAELASQSKTNQITIGKNGVCERVLSFLAVYPLNSEVVSSACLAIDKLCYGCVENSSIFGGKGACEIITDILEDHQHSAKVMRAASCAIASLSSTTKENSVRMGHEDICSKLFRNLKQAFTQRDDTLFASSLIAFKSLSDGSLTNQLEYGEVGACELLIEILMDWRRGPIFTASILEAIAGLCRHESGKSTFIPPNVNRFVAINAPLIVFSFLLEQKENSEVVRFGCSVLYYFIACCPGVLTSLSWSDLSRFLSYAIAQHIRAAATIESSCLLLELLIYTTGEVVHYLRDQALITTIADSFRIHSNFGNQNAESPQTSQRVCLCVSTLLEYGKQPVGQLIEHTDFSIHICSTLSDMKGNPGYCRLLCATISRMLTYCDESSLVSLFRQRGLCETLVRALVLYVNQSAEVASDVCDAMIRLTKNSQENQSRCVTAGVCEALSESLEHYSADSRYCLLALTLINLICRNPFNKTTFSSLGTSKTILKIIGDHLTNFDVISVAGLAASAMLHENSNASDCFDSSSFDLFQSLCLSFDDQESCDPAIIYSYVYLLRNMLSRHCHLKERIDKRFFEVLIAFFYRFSASLETLSQVLLLISCISRSHVENSKIFLNCGICEAIAAILKLYTSQEVLASVCICLSSLACSEDCISQLSDLEVLSNILNLPQDVQLEKNFAVSWCDLIYDTCSFDRVTASLNRHSTIVLLISLLKCYPTCSDILTSFCKAMKVLATPSEVSIPEFEDSDLLTLLHGSVDTYHRNEVVLEALLELLAMICCRVPRMIENSVAWERRLNNVLQRHRLHLNITLSSLNLFILLFQRLEEINQPMVETGFSESISYILKEHSHHKGIADASLQSICYLSRDSVRNVKTFLQHEVFEIVKSYFSEDLNQIPSVGLLLDVIRIWNESDSSTNSLIAESGIPMQILKMFQLYSRDLRSSFSSATFTISACRTIDSLLCNPVNFLILSRGNILELIAETFHVYLSNSDVLSTLSSVLTKLIQHEPSSLPPMISLGLSESTILAMKCQQSPQCCVHISNLISALILSNRELILPLFLENNKVSEIFTEVLTFHSKNHFVYKAMAHCLTIVCGTGFGFSESSALYPLLVDALQTFLEISLETVMSVCDAIVILSKFSPRIADKFGALGLCGQLLHIFCVLIKQGQSILAKTVIQLLQILFEQCPSNRERSLSDDGLLELMAVLEEDRVSDLNLIIYPCNVITLLSNSCESNALLFSTSALWKTLILILEKLKLERSVVIAICVALKSTRHESVSSTEDFDSKSLAKLSADLRSIYATDGETLACALSLLSLSSVRQELDIANREMLQKILDTFVITLQRSLHDPTVAHEMVQGIYAVLKEFPLFAVHLLEQNICHLFCQVLSTHSAVPKLVSFLYLTIQVLGSNSKAILEQFQTTPIVILTVSCLDQPQLQDSKSALVSISLGIKVLLSNETLKRSFRQTEVSNSLLSLLQIHDSRTTLELSTLLECLHELCLDGPSSELYSRAVVVTLISQGACQVLMELLRSHLINKPICLTSVMLLGNFFHDIEGRLQLVSTPICKILLEGLVMHEEDYSICLAILSFLNEIVTYEDIVDISLLQSKESKLLLLDILTKHCTRADIVLAASGNAFGITKANRPLVHSEIETKAMETILTILDHYSKRDPIVVAQCSSMISNLISKATCALILEKQSLETLILAANNFRDNAVIVENLFAIVVQTTELDDSLKKHWTTTGFCELCIVLTNLHFRSPSVGYAACRAIVSLATNNSHVITLFGNFDAAKVVAGVLQWNLSTDLRATEAAVKAIRALSFMNAKNVTAFGSFGVCAMVVKFLLAVQNDIRSTELGIETIWELSQDMTNKDRFVASEAPKLILNAADAWSTDVKIARVVSGSILQLSMNDAESQKLFNSLATPQKLEKILKLHPKQEEISKLCCGALWSLSSNNSQVESSSETSSSCRVLMDTLQGHMENVEVVSTVLSTVSSMCQNPSLSQIFGMVGACEVISKTLEFHRENPHVVAFSCLAVARLSHGEQNKQKFFGQKMVQTLSSIIQTEMSNTEIILTAYLAIGNLIKNRVDIAQEFLDSQFHEMVLKTLKTHPSNPEIHRIVFKTVSDLIELIPSTAIDFGATGTCEIVTNSLHEHILNNEGSSSVEYLYLMHVLCTDPTNITKIVVAGALPSMIQAAERFLTLPEVILSFASVVQMVTSPTVPQRVQHQVMLANEGACQVLVQAISTYLSDKALLSQILRALLAVCFQNFNNCESYMIQNSCLDNLFSALETYSKVDLEISVTVCSLIVITATPDVSEYLGRLGACDHVVNSLQLAILQESIEGCETIAYSIVCLIRGNSGNQNAFGRNVLTCELLVSMLTGWARVSIKAEDSALWAIALLAKHSSESDSVCHENINRLRSAGVFPAVISTVSKHLEVENSALIGCRAIGNLSLIQNEEDIELLGALGASDVTLRIISKHLFSKVIVELALESLNNLSVTLPNLLIMRQLNIEKVISGVLDQYSSSNREILVPMCKLTCSLARESEMRKSLSEIKLCDSIVQFFVLFHYHLPYASLALKCFTFLLSAPDECFRKLSDTNLQECLIEDYLPTISHTNAEELILIIPETLQVLILLAEHSTENCHRQVRLGACKVLVGILQHLSTNKLIVNTVASLLRVLALNCENTLLTLHDLGHLDYLLATFQQLEDDDDSSPINQVLQVLMTDPNTRSDIGLQSSSALILKPLKAGVDAGLIEQSCHAIVRLVRKSKDIIPILTNLGLCEVLPICMRKHIKVSSLLSSALTVVEVVCDGQPEVPAKMRANGVCDVVASAFRRHTNVSTTLSEVAGPALRAIYQLACDQENSASFNLSGGCELIAQVFSIAITSRNEQIVGLAARAIYKLCEKSSSNLESFGIIGVCVSISTALSGIFNSESTLEYLLLALAFLCRQDNHISSENLHNITAFYNLQIDEKVITILKKSLISPKIASSGSLAIQRLARDELSINRLCDLGACEVIPNILSRYISSNIEVSINAISALDSLSVVERNVNLLMREGTVLAVSQLLNQYGSINLNVAISCFNIVCHITDVQDHLLEEFIANGFCEGTLKACFTYGEDVPSYFVVALCSSVRCLVKYPEAVRRFEVNQFGEILMKYFLKFEMEEDTTTSLCEVLTGLSHSEAMCMYLIASGAHVHFIACLRRHMKSIQIGKCITTILTRLLNPNKQGRNLIEVFVDAGLTEILLGIARRYPENSDIILKVCMILSVIGLNDTVSISLGHDGGCEIILNALRTFPGDPGAILYGCKAVRTLCGNDENRIIFLSLGILETILVILKRFLHTESVVTTACSALVSLQNLSVSSKNEMESENRNTIMDASGDLLKLLIVQIESPVVVEQLCLLFNSMTIDERSRRILGSHDVCRSISMVLQKHIHSEAVVKEAVMLVSRLAYKCDENRYQFTKTNISECLMKAYKLHSTNVAIIECCCLAITALTQSNEENAVTLGRYGVCEMVTTILSERTSNPFLCGVACQTVYSLTKVQTNLEEFKQLNLSVLVIQCLKQHFNHSSVIKHISTAIAAYSQLASEVTILMNLGVCKLLVKTLLSQMTNKEAIPAIVAAITSLASKSQDCALEFKDNSINNSLLTALATYRETPAYFLQITSSMLTLSTNCQPLGLMFSSSTLFDLLVSGLRTYSTEVPIIERVCQLLITLVPTDAARSSAGISGVCEALARVFEMYEGNEKLISIISITISSLCDNHTANSDRCAKSKLCLMILRGLEQSLSNVEVTNSLLLAVKSLSNTTLNRRFFGGGDGCELFKIVFLKNLDHKEVVVSTSNAIGSICEDNFENKEMFGRIGMMELLLKAMKLYKEQEAVIIACCELLHVLTFEHKDNTGKLCDEHVAELFVTVFTVHPTSSGVCIGLCRLFVLLLRHSPGYVGILDTLNVRGLVVPSLALFQGNTMASLYSIRLLRDLYACGDEDKKGVEPLGDECENVTNILRANVGNMMINEDACSVIFLLSRNRASPGASVFGSLGACELISQVAKQALEKKSIPLAKMVLLAMVSLCAGNRENQDRFGESDACATAVSILDTLSDDSALSIDMEGAALNAIAMLARSSKLQSSENVLNLKKLHAAGACESVTRCLELRLDNMPLVYSACRAIFCMASDEDCNRRLIRCNASDLITRVLKTYQTFPAISQFACGAVANLGSNSQGAASLFAAGICDPLINAIVLNKKDVQLATHGCNALKNLSADNLEIRTSLGSAGGCKAIISVFKLHMANLALLSSALLAISNLSLELPIHVEFFMQANVPQRLVKILDEHRKDEFICCCVFKVLASLSLHHFANNDLLATGILELIPNVINMHLTSREVIRECCLSLTRLLKIDHSTSVEFESLELCDILVPILSLFDSNEQSLMDLLYDTLITLSNAHQNNRRKLSSLISSLDLPCLLEEQPLDTSADAILLCRCVLFYALNSVKRMEIGDPSCSRIVTLIAKYFNQEEVIRLAMIAAFSLTKKCPENQFLFGEAGICAQLTSLMSFYSKSEGTSLSICMAVLAIIKDNDTNLRGMAQIEFCIAFCSYTDHFWAHPRDCQSICQLVLALCNSSDCKSRLGKYHMCDYLARAAHASSQSPSLLKLTLETCQTLSVDHKDNILSMGSTEMCKTIHSIFQTHLSSLELMIPTIQLCAILSNNQTIRVRMGDVGICDCVVECCRRYHTNGDVLTATLSTIRAMASNVPMNKKIFGEVGACELLVEILKFGYCDDHQIEIACGAIANLSNESSSQAIALPGDGQGTSPSNVLRLDQSGIITALVEIFQNHITSAAIMKQTCSIIRFLTSSPSAPQKKLGELEICDKVVNALAMHFQIPTVNLMICSSLRGLAQDSENKILVGMSGGCSVVTKLLRFSVESGDLKLTEEVLLTIASLVQGSCLNQETTGKAGACEMISELIGADNGVLIDEKALWCVTYLCRSGFDSNTTNDKNISIFSMNGVVESIFLDLELYSQETSLVIAASWALRNLCSLQSNALQVLNSGRFEMLLKILSSQLSNQPICEAVCYALSTILIIDWNVPLARTGICELLTQLLHRHLSTPSIVDRCCSCIANLASHGTEYRHRFSVANVCSLLVRAMKLHKEFNAVVEEACGAVWNMCLDSPENRIKFGLEGGCELIVELLRQHQSDVYVKEAAVGAIRSLVVGNIENLRRVESCGIKIEGNRLTMIHSSEDLSQQPHHLLSQEELDQLPLESLRE
jgi:hypothetical protein